MTEDKLKRSIEHFIEKATTRELIEMAHQGLEDYFIEHPKESIAFITEWHPDGDIDRRTNTLAGGTECH